jgi:hypothetical protein
MPSQNPSEQFWKLYENLPPQTKEALFSEETGNNIYKICTDNDIADKIDEVVGLVGQILVGTIKADDSKKPLEDMGIEAASAQKIADELDVSIFLPLKKKISDDIIDMPQEKTKLSTESFSEKKLPAEEAAPEVALQKIEGDTYREIIE